MNYKHLEIDSKAMDALKHFHLPEQIGYGKIGLPIMVCADFQKGEWGTLQMIPYGPFQMDPATKVLHYGQEIFEGMKAYRHRESGVSVFRPDFIRKRMNNSAKRMAMPEIPESYFMEAVHAVAAHGAPFIPTGPGESLYIRPIMIATEVSMGIAPSTSFRFVVMAFPSTAYYSAGSLDVLIEREYCRAAPGGTGLAKTGGNYAAGLRATLKAEKLGFQQTVWLDAVQRRYVEELSGMNFFAVIDGTLTTPEPTDTILRGNTRDSLLKLAGTMNIPTQESRIDIDDLKSAIQAGKCTEAFGCGTATIVVSIACLGEEDGSKVTVAKAPGPITTQLRRKLVGIHERTEFDDFGWMTRVSDE